MEIAAVSWPFASIDAPRPAGAMGRLFGDPVGSRHVDTSAYRPIERSMA